MIKKTIIGALALTGTALVLPNVTMAKGEVCIETESTDTGSPCNIGHPSLGLTGTWHTIDEYRHLGVRRTNGQCSGPRVAHISSNNICVLD